MTTSVTAFPVVIKQIAEYTAASARSGTDKILLQQGATGTPYTYDTLAGLLKTHRAVAVSAAGTTQGTATALTSQVVIATTVASGTGVKLDDYDTTVLNRGANDLKVYPPTGAQIESEGTNVAVIIPPNGSAEFLRTSSTQFYVR